MDRSTAGGFGIWAGIFASRTSSAVTVARNPGTMQRGPAPMGLWLSDGSCSGRPAAQQTGEGWGLLMRVRLGHGWGGKDSWASSSF